MGRPFVRREGGGERKRERKEIQHCEIQRRLCAMKPHVWLDPCGATSKNTGEY